jgi:hypothetical protein
LIKPGHFHQPDNEKYQAPFTLQTQNESQNLITNLERWPSPPPARIYSTQPTTHHMIAIIIGADIFVPTILPD